MEKKESSHTTSPPFIIPKEGEGKGNCGKKGSASVCAFVTIAPLAAFPPEFQARTRPPPSPAGPARRRPPRAAAVAAR